VRFDERDMLDKPIAEVLRRGVKRGDETRSRFAHISGKKRVTTAHTGKRNAIRIF